SRANPLTGELLDADIIFDADLVRFFKLEGKILGVGGVPSMEQFPSMIQALKRGWTLPNPGLLAPNPFAGEGAAASWDSRRGPEKEVSDKLRRLWAIGQGHCQCANCMKFELGLAALTVGIQEAGKEPAKETEREKKLEELVGQAIKMVVMHEVG